MFLIKNYIPVKSFFTLFLSLFFLSSCSDKKIVHSNYIPSESNIVLSVNTAKIFNTAAFDLIGYNNLFNDLSSGPISSMILNPADAGLKMLSKYHFFLLGSNLLDVKFGAILPLSDGDELADYVTKNLQAEIIKSEGFQTAKIPGNHNLVWDDYTAVYYSGAPGGDLMNEAKNIFEQKSEKKLAEIDSTFSSALNSNAHISMWIKNNQVAKLIDQGLMLLSDLNVIDLPLMKTNISEQGKTVFLTNFNEGNITINQLGYLSS
jgi:hypothetical protein